MDREEWEAQMELLKMSREELDKVDYDLKKWQCQAKGCTCGTKIRDYGISPYFYHPTKKGAWARLDNTFWLCGKHNKFYKHLTKIYASHLVQDRLLDNDKTPIEKLTEIKFIKTNKINE